MTLLFLQINFLLVFHFNHFLPKFSCCFLFFFFLMANAIIQVFSFFFFAYCCCLYLTFSFWVKFLSSLSTYFINLFRKERNMSQNVFISFFLLNNNVTSSVKLLSWVICFQCWFHWKKGFQYNWHSFLQCLFAQKTASFCSVSSQSTLHFSILSLLKQHFL